MGPGPQVYSNSGLIDRIDGEKKFRSFWSRVVLKPFAVFHLLPKNSGCCWKSFGMNVACPVSPIDFSARAARPPGPQGLQLQQGDEDRASCLQGHWVAWHQLMPVNYRFCDRIIVKQLIIFCWNFEKFPNKNAIHEQVGWWAIPLNTCPRSLETTWPPSQWSLGIILIGTGDVTSPEQFLCLWTGCWNRWFMDTFPIYIWFILVLKLFVLTRFKTKGIWIERNLYSHSFTVGF